MNTKTIDKSENKHIQKKINEYLTTPTERLYTFSLNLIERNKLLNEDLNRLINLQKFLKIKEINNSNKKIEFLILEKNLDNKNNM